MNTLDRIREQSLESYISSQTGFQWRSVGTWKDLEECPICGGHDCFRLTPDGQDWYCFQCYRGGDIIWFRALYEGITYKEAIVKFKVEMGIKAKDPEDLEWDLLRQSACEYLSQALFTCQTKYQFKKFLGTPLEYLLQVRKHSLDAIIYFKVGFNDGKLLDTLEQQYPMDTIKAVGLHYIGEGCFTYPFIVNNQVSYFRLKDPNKIKTFQMPSGFRFYDPVWYNQDILKSAKAIWVCEGEDDALSLWDCGVHTVATCGGLQLNQVRFLKKYDPEVVFLAFDNDNAGKQDLETFVKHWQDESVLMVNIPEGKDIDDLIRASESPKELIEELKAFAIMPAPEMRTRIRERDGCYFITRTYGDVKITNWTLSLDAIIYSDADKTTTWKCKLTSNAGFEKIVYPDSLVFSRVALLREFLLNQAKVLYFKGSENDLVELVQYFSIVYSPKRVIESDYVGETIDGVLTKNTFISFMTPEAELRALVNGYLQIDENTSVRIIPLVKRGAHSSELPYFEITEPIGGIESFKKKVFDLLVKNRNYKVIIALGWLKATLYSKALFDHFHFFPLLCLHGKFGSGKSVLANWLMSVAGLRDCNPEMLSDKGTTEVGLARKLAYYSSLPVFCDDYRADDTGQRFHTFMRGVFDRTSATKGIKDEFGVRRVIIRGTLLLTGEHIPTDSALCSRMIAIELTKAERNDQYYPEILKLEPQFSAIGLDWIKRKVKDLPGILEKQAQYEAILNKELDDPRQSACFSIVLACILNEKALDEGDILDYTIKLAKGEMVEQRAEEVLSRLWECVDILDKKGELDEQEINCNIFHEEIAVHLPNLMGKVSGSQWTRHYKFPNNRELVKLLKQEPYLKASKSVRIGNKVAERWILDLKKCPQVLKNLYVLPEEKREQEFI